MIEFFKILSINKFNLSTQNQKMWVTKETMKKE